MKIHFSNSNSKADDKTVARATQKKKKGFETKRAALGPWLPR